MDCKRAARTARRRRRRTAVDGDGGQGRRLAYARASARGGGRVKRSTAHTALAFGACASVRGRRRAPPSCATRSVQALGEEGKRGHMTWQTRHLRRTRAIAERRPSSKRSAEPLLFFWAFSNNAYALLLRLRFRLPGALLPQRRSPGPTRAGRLPRRLRSHVPRLALPPPANAVDSATAPRGLLNFRRQRP
jgi:hypothetical protein